MADYWRVQWLGIGPDHDEEIWLPEHAHGAKTQFEYLETQPWVRSATLDRLEVEDDTIQKITLERSFTREK